MIRILSAHSASIVGAVVVLGGAAWSLNATREASAEATAAVQAQPPAKRVINGRSGAMLTPGIMIGNTLYLSGQLGLGGRADGVAGETKASISSAENILKAADMSLADVVSVTAYLVDAGDYQAFNSAYTSMFTSDPRPVRTTVFVKELVNGAKVELTMIAVKAAAQSPASGAR